MKNTNLNIMKNAILIISIAAMSALGISSCAKDDPYEQKSLASETINFRPAMGSLTKATETNNSNLGSIYVTSFMGNQKYFQDVEFFKGADGFYTSENEYDWPGDDTQLSFYSYSPSMDALGADITISDKNILQLEDFVTPEQIADQVDFITASATGKRSVNEESGVPLTFSHRLAQIEIRAKSENQTYIVKAA